jgi:thioredoxin 1
MSAAASCSAAARVAPAARLGAPQATALRPALARAALHARQSLLAARQSLATRRRAAGIAFAVLEINEATWEAEVIEVRGRDETRAAPAPAARRRRRPADSAARSLSHQRAPLLHRSPPPAAAPPPPQASKAGNPVLVDFWATWCGPCKLVAPSMVWAEKEFGEHLKVVKINVTESAKAPAVKELMERYRVYGLPCLVVFKGGEELEGSHREGAITKKGLGEYLETHLGLKPAPAA